MRNPRHRFQPGRRRILGAAVAGTAVASAMWFGRVLAETAAAYSKTRQALHNRYIDEVHAHQKYTAYAQKAVADGYPNVGQLFIALAHSEAIHARNFKRLLGELGAKVPMVSRIEIPLTGTKQNILHATAVEKDEIDREYPAILERIRPENHTETINFITYAWKAEKQHRKLLGKMQSAAKKWFSFLIAHIEGEFVTYYVCQVCGSTLTKLPKNRCPICNQPVSNYRAIERLAPPRGDEG
jgi:rubrerythrin